MLLGSFLAALTKSRVVSSFILSDADTYGLEAGRLGILALLMVLYTDSAW